MREKNTRLIAQTGYMDLNSNQYHTSSPEGQSAHGDDVTV
jgi:hypothetical protein